MTDRPDIPKKFAAKIVTAQKKVDDVRSWNAGSLRRRAQDQTRIDEFEADPVAFARKHYQNHGADSYPVQTNIGRCRDNIAYSIGRDELRRERLIDAESNLIGIERKVLDEVQSMRPSAGRVPWPAPRTISDWERDDALMLAELDRQHEEWKVERAAEDAIALAEEAIEEAAREAQEKLDDQAQLEDWRTWSDEKKVAWRLIWGKMIEDLKAGKFGLSDAMEYYDSGDWKR